MPDISLTGQMQQRVRQFCEELAGNSRLEDEVREELETYFQDKMLGYLSREEALTEEDAFILAREHFGDEELVKGLLLEVHHDGQVGAVNRWFLAGAVFALAGYVYTRVFSLLPSGLAGALIEIWGTPPMAFFLVFFALSAGMLVIALACNWRRNRASLDRLFGWYFVAMFAGGLVGMSPRALMAGPVSNTILFLAFQACAVVVAAGFFRKVPWTKWAVLALLVLVLAPWWRLGISNGMPAAYNVGNAVSQINVEYIETPPNWYMQTLLLLALIHCFAPRPRYSGEASAARQPAAG